LRCAEEKGYANKRWVSESGLEKGGRPFCRGTIYRILASPVYIGDVTYKGQVYQGEHEAIIERDLWDKVRAQAAQNRHGHGKRHGLKVPPAMLKGLVFTIEGHALTPSYTKKRDRLYRYYTSVGAIKKGFDTVSVSNISAEQLEKVVIEQMRRMLHTPEVVAATCRKIRELGHSVNERAISQMLGKLEDTWEHLFPAEQGCLVRMLVHKVIVSPDGIRMYLNAEGVHNVALDIAGGTRHVA